MDKQDVEPSRSVAPQLPKSRIHLEIAVASVDDALAAEAGGADRLELNTALSLGGLTPSIGTLIEVRQATKLPLIVMLRPRPGAFCYRAAELRVLLRDLDLLLNNGADGIAFGVLNEDATVDRLRCHEVVRKAGNHPVVFHRAFDLTPEPLQALDILADLGVCRVMTSGQQATALAGASQIAALVRQAAGRIEILPAGGINGGNVNELLQQTACDWVHAGLRGSGQDPSGLGRPQLNFSSPPLPLDRYELTDGVLVRRLREVIDSESALDH